MSPDAAELLRANERRTKKLSLVIGLVMIAAGLGLWFGSRATFHGAMQLVTPAMCVLGLVFAVRGALPSGDDR